MWIVIIIKSLIIKTNGKDKVIELLGIEGQNLQKRNRSSNITALKNRSQYQIIS